MTDEPNLPPIEPPNASDPSDLLALREQALEEATRALQARTLEADVRDAELEARATALDTRAREVESTNEAVAAREARLKAGEAAADDRELALFEAEEIWKQRTRELAATEAALAPRTAALDARSREQAEEAAALAVREQAARATLGAAEALGRRNAEEHERQQRAVEEAKLGVSSLESQVLERDRAVRAREIEADAGFAERNRHALLELEERERALRAELSRLDAALVAERRSRFDVLEAALTAERTARVDALDAELRERRAQNLRETQEAMESARRLREVEREAHAAALAKERAEHTAALAKDHAESAASSAAERRSAEEERQKARSEAAARTEALDAREGALQEREARVSWREQELGAVRAEIEAAARRGAAEQVAALERELEQLRSDYRGAMDGQAALQRQLDGHEHVAAQFDGLEPAEILRRMNALRGKNETLFAELQRRPSESDRERLRELLEHERTWDTDRQRFQKELSELRAQRDRWLIGVAELEGRRDQQEIAERRLSVLKAEMERYAEDVRRLQTIYERSEERSARVGAIEEPWDTDLVRAMEDPDLTEVAWLDRIVAGCAAAGMRFPRRLVYAFHTALKAAELSPITVLAGVSGTGKSELPRLYSRFGGFAFLSMAVQPNWDSPQSLFGFFNSVDNRFNATTLLRALAQSQQRKSPMHPHGFDDLPLLVLLDEMNLAYIEQYFSDILSKLEQRRGEDDVVLELDLGAGMAGYPLRLGRNVRWVGTMNEDETTKALSDKVIDRSNLLYFPRPRTLYSRSTLELGPRAPLLPMAKWNAWIRRDAVLDTAELDRLRGALEQINGHLETVGRALGHRVWQAVASYVANHPDVIAARDAKDAATVRGAVDRAFEDQLVQKVMPKLRGIETSGHAKRACLDPIRKVLSDEGLALTEDFDIATKVGGGVFVWNSARYLESGG